MAEATTDEDILRKAREMEVKMIAALHITWGSIASDIMAVEIPGQKKRKYMKGTEVREVVADASYLETYGGDKEAAKYFRDLPRITRQHILKKAFPYRHYE